MSRLFAPLIAALLSSTAAPPVTAGAWLRPVGEGFFSWTVKVQDDENAKADSTIFAEYGINPDLTLGLDIGSDEGGDHKALAFVRMPLARDGLHVAFELAAGTLDDGAALRPGLSVGGSLALGDLGGWWNVDTRARMTTDDTELDMDATLGITVKEGTMLIGQIQHGGPIEDPDFLRLAGSVVWRISPKRHLEVGLTTALKDAEEFGVKVGVWRDF